MYWVPDECNTIFRIGYQRIYHYTLPGSLAAVALEAALNLHQLPYHLFVASSSTEFTSTALVVGNQFKSVTHESRLEIHAFVQWAHTASCRPVCVYVCSRAHGLLYCHRRNIQQHKQHGHSCVQDLKCLT